MHLTVSAKLILAFMGVTTVVLAATLLLAKWSFDRGFVDYINTVETQRLERLATDVSQLYAAADANWDTFVESPLGLAIQRSAHPGSRPPPFPGLPPPHRPPSERRQQPGDHRPGKPPGHRRGEGPGRAHLPPTGLYTVDNRYLAGITTDVENVIRVPVFEETRSQTIAWLIASPKVHLNDSAERLFATQQFTASLWIGAFAIVLTLMVSWLVARMLLNPLHQLHRAVNRLARGQYDPVASNHVASGRDEIAQLQQNVNNLANVLKENQSVRKRWLAEISHELRTPITILVGELEALSAGLRPLDQTQIDSLLEEVNHLNKIVEDLYELALSDIGGLRYQFEITDITRLVGDVVQSMNNQQSQIEISYTADPTEKNIRIDPSRIKQLVLNILRNSLLYTDFPGTITVTLASGPKGVVLKVIDSAPSVPEKDCESLFEPLYRQDDARSRLDHSTGQGAGLGLAICRNIVNAHQGKISARPSSLGGLEVTIELPE